MKKYLIMMGIVSATSAMGWGIYQEFSSSREPGQYILPTLARVTAEYEALENLVHNPNLSPTEFQIRLRTLVALNKKDMHIRYMSETGQTIAEDPVDSTVPNTDSESGQSGSEESEDSLPSGVPSIGYTVGLYTYAGFEPGKYYAHQNTTDPSIAGKYALYRYLIENEIDPNTNWGPAAADALNKKYNTKFFVGKGQTIEYGNQFVRSAPNGYGLFAYQYDSKARGEFFWSFK